VTPAQAAILKVQAGVFGPSRYFKSSGWRFCALTEQKSFF